MFKKLVANFAFNPSLLKQIGLYADQLKREKNIRLIGLVFLCGTLLIQIIAFVNPPENSLSTSNNDIASGVQTKSDILRSYDAEGSSVADIYSHFGISRDDLTSITDTPNAIIRTNDGNNWQTIGRSPLSGQIDMQTNYLTALPYGENDTESSDEDKYIYQRPLKSWDFTKPYNIYDGFSGKHSKTGQDFWILKGSGALAWKDNWANSSFNVNGKHDPKLEIRISNDIAASYLTPGDEFTLLFEYRNAIIGTIASDAYLESQLDLTKYDVISPKSLPINPAGYLRQPITNLSGTNYYRFFEITLRLKAPLSSPTTICNTADITALETGRNQGNETCFGVLSVCPFDPTIPDTNNPNCTEPKAVCTLKIISIDRRSKVATLRTEFTSSNPSKVKVARYHYNYEDDQEISLNSSEITNETTYNFLSNNSKPTATVHFAYTTTERVIKDSSTICSADLNFDSNDIVGRQLSTLSFNKDQQSVTDKITTGDVIELSFHTLNSKDYTLNNIEISSDIHDITEYADIDLNELEKSGGNYDVKSHKISWNIAEIKSRTKNIQTLKITIKTPIPPTNSPSSNSTSYDCRISNLYGNETTLMIDCPDVKLLESLPQTRPITSLIVTLIATLLSLSLYARSSLFIKELVIIRSDYIKN